MTAFENTGQGTAAGQGGRRQRPLGRRRLGRQAKRGGGQQPAQPKPGTRACGWWRWLASGGFGERGQREREPGDSRAAGQRRWRRQGRWRLSGTRASGGRGRTASSPTGNTTTRQSDGGCPACRFGPWWSFPLRSSASGPVGNGGNAKHPAGDGTAERLAGLPPRNTAQKPTKTNQKGKTASLSGFFPPLFSKGSEKAVPPFHPSRGKGEERIRIARKATLTTRRGTSGSPPNSRSKPFRSRSQTTPQSTVGSSEGKGGKPGKHHPPGAERLGTAAAKRAVPPKPGNATTTRRPSGSRCRWPHLQTAAVR
jgi:hypothetical protein